MTCVTKSTCILRYIITAIPKHQHQLPELSLSTNTCTHGLTSEETKMKQNLLRSYDNYPHNGCYYGGTKLTSKGKEIVL